MRHVAEIPDLGFAAPIGLPPGLEVMTLADLRGRAADRMGAGADGTLIIFEQGFLDQATSAHLGDPYGTVVRVPAEPDQAALRAATSALEGEFRTPGRLPLEIHLAILRHLLSVVVLNLAQLGASPGRPAPQATQTFCGSATRSRPASPVPAGLRTTHGLSAIPRARSPAQAGTPLASERKSTSTAGCCSRRNGSSRTATSLRRRSRPASASPAPRTSASSSTSARVPPRSPSATLCAVQPLDKRRRPGPRASCHQTPGPRGRYPSCTASDGRATAAAASRVAAVRETQRAAGPRAASAVMMAGAIARLKPVDS
jgi:hypothetical protein